MNKAKPYKPTRKFDFKFNSIGFILMIISMMIFGITVSWLYLWINSIMPRIYLCMLCAICCSIAIGIVGCVFVKIFKIRFPMIAVLATVISLIFVNYIKWVIYVSDDCNKYQYSQMKSQTASEYYLGEKIPDIESYIEDDAFVESFIKNLKKDDSYTDKSGNKSYWDINDFDNVFGKNPDEVKESLLKINNMSAYDYFFTYRKQQPHTISYLATHPLVLFKDISSINKVGRWSISSSHYLSSSSVINSNVKGILLYLVWIGELIILVVPAIFLIYRKASFPFIEKENSWAIVDKPKPKFNFKMSVDQETLKNNLLNDVDFLFKLKPLSNEKINDSNFYSLTYCRSKFFDKIFISLAANTVNNGNKNVSTVVEYIIVDKYYIASIYKMFGLNPPIECNDIYQC